MDFAGDQFFPGDKIILISQNEQRYINFLLTGKNHGNNDKYYFRKKKSKCNTKFLHWMN